MRKKILFILSLVFVFCFLVFNFSFGVYGNAVQKAKEVKNQVEERVRQKTEGEINQIQERTENEIQEGIPNVTGITPSPIKVQENLRERFENMGEQHRSRVANMVQNLVRSAERWKRKNPGIGKEVREIAREQQQYMEKNRESLNKIQRRNRIIKFLIGTNYREIKKVRENIEYYKKEIEKLEKIKEKLEDEEDKKIIDEQINALNEEIQRMEEFLNKEEKGFSLFGWLFRRIFK